MRILSFFLTNSMAVKVYLCLFLCSSISLCLASYYDVCAISQCGSFHFGYPFGLKNSGCGDPDFQLHCDYQGGNPLINIGGDEYRILEPFFLMRGVNNNSMRIINNNLWSSKCDLSGNYSQFWFPASHFQIADTYTNITIWGECPEITKEFFPLRSGELCGNDWYYNMRRPEKGTHRCKTHFQLPIHREYQHFMNTNETFPWEGFEVTWHVDTNRYQSCEACLHSNGRCGYGMQEPTTFLCFCPDGNTYPDKCPEPGTEDTDDRKMSVIATGYFFAGVAVTAIAVAVVLFSTYDACKKRNAPPPQISQGNGNYVANPAPPSSALKSSVFTSTEKSSSIEIGV